MIKFLIVGAGLFLGTVYSEQIKMRELFSGISKNKMHALSLIEISSTSTSTPAPVKKAYSAAAEMSLAQYKLSPMSKVATFNAGKKKLEEAITSDTTNIECRYIRYTVQDNAPGFLGYNKNKTADRFFLIHTIASVKQSDPDLYARVCAYLILRSQLTPKEKTSIDG